MLTDDQSGQLIATVKVKKSEKSEVNVDCGASSGHPSDDLPTLHDWLVITLEPLCDAEPIGLANDILRLVTEDESLNILRASCIRRLKNILNECMKIFCFFKKIC
ncbi:unnamed protein product [Rotaria sp. Silwood1]|nr:unnamed protein product [Rotaria sp. Silwood1]